MNQTLPITVFHLLPDPEIDRSQIRDLKEEAAFFQHYVVLLPANNKKRSDFGEADVTIHSLQDLSEAGKALESLISEIETDWFLLLFGAEQVASDDLKSLDFSSTAPINSEIRTPSVSYFNSFLTTRLVHTNHSFQFERNKLPSITLESGSNHHSNSNKDETRFIRIKRNKPYFGEFDDNTLDSTDIGPFFEVLNHLRNKRLKKAEQLLNTLTNKHSSSYPYKATIYNLWAFLRLEQQKFQEAEAALEKSINLVANQYTPWVMRYHYYLIMNRLDDGYQALYTYLQQLPKGTNLTLDTRLPLTDTHYQLGEAASRMGDLSRALVHYEEYYRLQGTDPSREGVDLLEKLLLFATEIGDRKRTEHYFDLMFGSLLHQGLNNQQWKEIEEYIALFMAKGWYSYASSIYEALYPNNADKPRFIRRWTATLIKNGEIERAQKLINTHKSINF